MIAGNPSILKRGKSMNVVTGATGHIGNTLVRALLSRDAKVRCLVLPSEGREPLAGLDIETAMGDVRDSGSLEAAFAGADVVYHLASVITLSPRQGRLLKAVNVGGAANVVEACRRTGVRRLVYVSSIHAIAEPPQGTVIDETMPIDPSRIHMAYGKSKAEATRIVLRAAGQGLDAVVVCPTGVIGPYDFRLSEMGRLFLTFAKRRLPAFVDGAYDFVDVRDVAEGLIAAADKGRTGEVYILSGELVTVRRLMGLLGGVTGTRAPRFLAPAWLADVAAAATEPFSRLAGARPLFTRESLLTLRSNSLTSHAKASTELGWRPRPITESIADTIQWFRREKFLKPAARLAQG